MKVFEYVIVHQPSKPKKAKPYIVDDEIFVCFAENRDQVVLEAGKSLAGDIPLDEVEIIVRPFE